MAATDFGRPIVAPPGFPADKTKIFREAFMKAMNDPELLAEAKEKTTISHPPLARSLKH